MNATLTEVTELFATLCKVEIGKEGDDDKAKLASELDSPTQRAREAHLAGLDACRKYFERLARDSQDDQIDRFLLDHDDIEPHAPDGRPLMVVPERGPAPADGSAYVETPIAPDAPVPAVDLGNFMQPATRLGVTMQDLAAAGAKMPCVVRLEFDNGKLFLTVDEGQGPLQWDLTRNPDGSWKVSRPEAKA